MPNEFDKRQCEHVWTRRIWAFLHALPNADKTHVKTLHYSLEAYTDLSKLIDPHCSSKCILYLGVPDLV
jgi:hypothetical protein